MPPSAARKKGRTQDLHGSAPDECRVAPLIIDMINAFDFEGAPAMLLAHLGAETLILTGVAGNFCVLFTVHDAYMREHQLVVPSDCIASQTEDDDRYALEHMAKVTKADTRPSSGIDLSALKQ